MKKVWALVVACVELRIDDEAVAHPVKHIGCCFSSGKIMQVFVDPFDILLRIIHVLKLFVRHYL